MRLIFTLLSVAFILVTLFILASSDGEAIIYQRSVPIDSTNSLTETASRMTASNGADYIRTNGYAKAAVLGFLPAVLFAYSAYRTRPRRPKVKDAPAIELPDDIPVSQVEQVISLIQEGNRSEATTVVQGMIKADPQNADAWYLAGILTADPAKKSGYYKRALSINPAHAKALKALAALKPKG